MLPRPPRPCASLRLPLPPPPHQHLPTTHTHMHESLACLGLTLYKLEQQAQQSLVSSQLQGLSKPLRPTCFNKMTQRAVPAPVERENTCMLVRKQAEVKGEWRPGRLVGGRVDGQAHGWPGTQAVERAGRRTGERPGR